jgi:hypothetical protein
MATGYDGGRIARRKQEPILVYVSEEWGKDTMTSARGKKRICVDENKLAIQIGTFNVGAKVMGAKGILSVCFTVLRSIEASIHT